MIVEYEGTQWPADEVEAAGQIPEELWEVSLAEEFL